jgi:hypothetical protein
MAEADNAPANTPKSTANEPSKAEATTTQQQNAFRRLTLELSRPAAGRRLRASVA